MVCKPISHTGRVRPPHIRLASDELGIQRLNSLANFDETYPNGVKNEPVGEIAPSEVAPDRGDGVNDIGEALLVVS